MNAALTPRPTRSYHCPMTYAIPPAVLDFFLYFSGTAFVGWILETVYRSRKERRFVNAGFLSGPFVPIYGFGATIIALIEFSLRAAPPVVAWSAILLSPTVLEYVGAWLLERLFGMTLWDYREERFNLRGRICLRFSAYWALLAAFTVLVVEPAVLTRIRNLGPYLSHFVAGGLLFYFVSDAIHSVQSVFNYKAFLADIRTLVEQGKSFLPAFDIAYAKKHGGRRRLPVEIRRFMRTLTTFPSLRREIRPNFHVFPDWIRDRLESRFGKHEDS